MFVSLASDPPVAKKVWLNPAGDISANFAESDIAGTWLV